MQEHDCSHTYARTHTQKAKKEDGGGGGAEGGSKAERDRASKGNKGEVDTEIDEVRFCA